MCVCVCVCVCVRAFVCIYPNILHQQHGDPNSTFNWNSADGILLNVETLLLIEEYDYNVTLAFVIVFLSSASETSNNSTALAVGFQNVFKSQCFITNNGSTRQVRFILKNPYDDLTHFHTTLLLIIRNTDFTQTLRTLKSSEIIILTPSFYMGR